MYGTIISFIIVILFISLRLKKTIVKPKLDSIGRINKHGDVYEVVGDDMVFLKFYDIKNTKWVYALDVCETDTIGIKGVKIRKFERVVALTIAHKIDFDMFVHLHINMVRSIVRNKNLAKSWKY